MSIHDQVTDQLQELELIPRVMNLSEWASTISRCESLSPREDGRYPGFKAQTGREPIPGKDYAVSADFSQDDYEYYTGTGLYY